eukprot:TRINITY_DN3435_c0_g1_i1.p1 TRINITY_DN3435_c0_g1~~TRINITY_DN3435_c0_g1_i1.p1  ORF type:complete len:487 (-),score=141.18 TRINITY_DN3435_c0_g1_i1:140-1600(-)
MGGGSEGAEIAVEAIPDCPYLLSGVVNTKKVLFRVKTSAPPEEEFGDSKNEEEDEDETRCNRAPLNLCLVLDRSGSMERNNKLEFAKLAVISVLKALRNEDIVHLVVYDDTALVVFENATGEAKNSVIPLVNKINVGGQTCLSGGIEKGVQVLTKHQRPGYSQRMFVLSDGLVNKGIKDKEALASLVQTFHERDSIKFDSFGIGEDFDEDIMKAIADRGGSGFFYLQESEDIEPLVMKALQSVLSIVAQDARLIIQQTSGCVLTKIYGQDPASLRQEVKLGDLQSDNLRTLLCEFTVNPRDDINKTIEEHLRFEIIYNSVVPHPKGIVDVHSIEGCIRFKLTKDENDMTVDPRVSVFLAIQKSAEADLQVMAALQKRAVAEAIEIQERQIALLRANVERDDSKMVAMLLGIAEQSLQKMQQEGASKTTVKLAHHFFHMKSFHSSRAYVKVWANKQQDQQRQRQLELQQLQPPQQQQPNPKKQKVSY